MYTFVKRKAQGTRIFFIAEGKHANVDADSCRFALIIRRAQCLVKARGLAPVRHLSSKNLLQAQTQPGFTQAVVDYRMDPGFGLRIASGMDCVLAFACVCLADRFMNYQSMTPDESLRKTMLEGRFEDLEDPFRSQDTGKRIGTTLHVNALLY